MNPEPLALDTADDSAAPPSADAREMRVRRMVEAHFDGLWRFMRRLGVEPMDLDDAMQQVLEIAAARLGDIARPSERSFLFSTAFRIASEVRRRRESRHEVGDATLARKEDPTPEPDALTDRMQAQMRRKGVLP